MELGKLGSADPATASSIQFQSQELKRIQGKGKERLEERGSGSSSRRAVVGSGTLGAGVLRAVVGLGPLPHCRAPCCVGFASVCVGFDHNYRASSSSPLYFHSIHLPNKFYKVSEQPFP